MWRRKYRIRFLGELSNWLAQQTVNLSRKPWGFESLLSHNKRIRSLSGYKLSPVKRGIVGSSPTWSAKHGTYTLRLIRGWKVNWFHVGSIPTVPTKGNNLRRILGELQSHYALWKINLDGDRVRLLSEMCLRAFGSIPMSSAKTRMIRDQSWLISDLRLVQVQHTGQIWWL